MGKGDIARQAKANSAGFDKNPQNINREGRPLSFKKQYKKILQKDKAFIWVDLANTTTRTVKIKAEGKLEVVKEGEAPSGEVINQIGFELHGVEFLLYRINQISAGGNEKNALEAIKFLWEQFDGKARQTTENFNHQTKDADYSQLNDDELEMMNTIHQKLYGKSES